MKKVFTTKTLSDEIYNFSYMEEALQHEVTLSKYYATQYMIQEQMYQLKPNK